MKMKKVTLLGLVIILLAVSVVPVMAAGPNNGHGNGVGEGQGNGGGDQTRQRDRDRTHDADGSTGTGVVGNGNNGHTPMRRPFYLQGTIKSIGPDGKSVIVNVVHGNARVKTYIGSTLTVQVPDGIKIFKITQGEDNDTTPNKVPIYFKDLAAEQKVAIHGNLTDTGYVATLITVYIRVTNSEQEAETP